MQWLKTIKETWMSWWGKIFKTNQRKNNNIEENDPFCINCNIDVYVGKCINAFFFFFWGNHRKLCFLPLGRENGIWKKGVTFFPLILYLSGVKWKTLEIFTSDLHINNFLKFGTKAFIIMLWPLSSGCNFQNTPCAKQDSFIHFSFKVGKVWTSQLKALERHCWSRRLSCHFPGQREEYKDARCSLPRPWARSTSPL